MHLRKGATGFTEEDAMADRQVKRTGKDRDGDITSLCGDWGTVAQPVAIREIESGTHSYSSRTRGTVVPTSRS